MVESTVIFCPIPGGDKKQKIIIHMLAGNERPAKL